MKRLLIAPIALSLLLVGCGLSSKEKKAYQSEISLIKGWMDDYSYYDKMQAKADKYFEERNSYG